MMSSKKGKKRPCACGHKFLALDTHSLCVKCRSCNRTKMCKICAKWSQKEWSSFSPSDEVSTASTLVSDSSSGRSVGQSPLIAGGELADAATASSIGSQSSVPEESSDISPSVPVRPSPIPIGISHPSAEPSPAVSAMDVSPPYLAPQQAQIATSSQPVPAISSMAPYSAALYSGQVSQTAAYQHPDLANRLRPGIPSSSPWSSEGALFHHASYAGAFPQSTPPWAAPFRGRSDHNLFYSQSDFSSGSVSSINHPISSTHVPATPPTSTPSELSQVLSGMSDLIALMRQERQSSPSATVTTASTEGACPPPARTSSPSDGTTQTSTTTSQTVSQPPKSNAPAAKSKTSTPSRRSAAHRYGTSVHSEDDIISTSSGSRSEHDDQDSISVHAPTGEFDDEQNLSDGEGARSSASATKSASAEVDDAQATAEQSKEFKVDKYFSRCVAKVYEAFGDECPQPEAPISMTSISSRQLDRAQKRISTRSLPVTGSLLDGTDKVVQEIQGTRSNSVPLPLGKYPTLPSQERARRYRVHDCLFGAGLPKLDSDAHKVDSYPNSFKTVPLDRTAIHSLGHTVNANVRASIYADWMFALIHEKFKDQIRDTPDEEIFRAMSHIILNQLEFSVRTSASLQLMERDAFLNRSESKLTEELKAKARILPLDRKNLFAGKLEDFAEKATQHAQRNSWIDKPAKDAPPTPYRPKQSTNKPKPKGKAQYNRNQRARPQPYNKDQRGKNKNYKPFSTPATSNAGQSGQRS